MRYLSLIKRIKYIITSLLLLIATLSIGLSFNLIVSKSYDAYTTWQNCDADYVAYDYRKFDDNCYLYYGNTAKISKDKTNGGIVFDSDVYQFVDGINYDNASLLNPKNILHGKYKKLEGSEIAIPLAISKEYKLTIGSKLYINKKVEATVMYIFRDFYDIKDVDFNSDKSVVFIGDIELENCKPKSYAIFGNKVTNYNDVYPFGTALLSFKNNIILYVSLAFVIHLIICLFINNLYKNEKRKNLKMTRLSGDKVSYYQDLFLVGLVTIVIPSFIGLAISCAFINWTIGISILISTLIVYLMDILFINLKLKARR